MRAVSLAFSLGLLGAALPAFVQAQAAAAEPGSWFAQEADVFATRPGFSRLELPADVIAACRPDLSDLRLFDRSGKAIPYVAVRGMAPPRAQARAAIDAKVLDVKRDVIADDSDPKRVRERYELRTPDGDAPQTLVITVDHELLAHTELVAGKVAFVRTLELTFVPADGFPLALVRHGSVFSLPHAGESDKLVLGPLGKGKVQVELLGQGGYLEPRFAWVQAPSPPEAQRVAIELVQIATRRADGHSVSTFARPAGVVPSALSIETASQLFDREVHVRDASPRRALAELGSARFVREEKTDAGAFTLSLGEAHGDRLELDVLDQDSPPLEDLRVFALVPQPTLLFAVAAEPSSEPVASMRFGGGRTRAPHYDLEQLPSGEHADLNDAKKLAALPIARVGSARPNPKFEQAQPLRAAFLPGAELDTRPFAQVRTVTLPASREGLYRVALSAEDVALARPDLADVRIVDAARRQRAYLIDRDVASAELAAQVEVNTSTGVSRYRITPERGVRPVNAVALALAVASPSFDRGYSLAALRAGGQEQGLGAGRLVRRPAEPANDLRIELGPARCDALELSVENRDDAPLALASARVQIRLPVLYVVAEPGEYTLLLGHPDATAASYELERARDTVLAVESENAQLSPLHANPARDAAGKLALFQRPGAALDVQAFSHARSLRIVGSRDGLTQIGLEPEDLAVADPDLSDLRVVDAQGRQRPFLVRVGGEKREVVFAAPSTSSRDGHTRYRFELPHKPLPVSALTLTTDESYFNRSYRLFGRDPDDRELALTEGRLTRQADRSAATLVLAFAEARLSTLELEVDDGENAPLAFSHATAQVALPALYVVAEPGEYSLLLGQRQAKAPSYDLAQASALVFAVESVPAQIGPLHENPRYSSRTRLSGLAGRELALWIALALALIVLTGLTFRLVKQPMKED